MKKLVLFTMLLLSAAFCFSQTYDTIILTAGTKIPCKIFVVGDVTVNYEIMEEDGKLHRRKVATGDVAKLIFYKTPETENRDFDIPQNVESENVLIPGSDTMRYLLNDNTILRKRQTQMNEDLKTILANNREAGNHIKVAACMSVTAFCLGVGSAITYLFTDGDEPAPVFITGSLAMCLAIAVPIELFMTGDKLKGKK